LPAAWPESRWIGVHHRTVTAGSSAATVIRSRRALIAKTRLATPNTLARVEKAVDGSPRHPLIHLDAQDTDRSGPIPYSVRV